MTIKPGVHPATASRWADLTAVIGGTAVANKCWCAFWYVSKKQKPRRGPGLGVLQREG